MPAMIEMPPLQFAQSTRIRMGITKPARNRHAAGHSCHVPEIAFLLASPDQGAGRCGIRVIAPDQRGLARPTARAVESYDLEH